MKLLLDTHSFLWFVQGSSRLSAKARLLIEELSNEIFVSIISLWEIAIKVNQGKLRLDQPLSVFVPRHLTANRIELLDIAFDHVLAVSNMPLHHRDPFDRMLVAQALVDNLGIVSVDTALDAYAVTRWW